MDTWDEVSAEIPAGSEKMQLTVLRSGEKIGWTTSRRSIRMGSRVAPGFPHYCRQWQKLWTGREEMATTEYASSPRRLPYA